MTSTQKIAVIYVFVLILLNTVASPTASAQSSYAPKSSAVVLTEDELDRVLAPVALYPDTLLTHILVASTYPMDVIRAARWREKNADLDHQAVLDRVEVFAWDPSVKALTPFADVLTQMSDDLDWLNFLGDSVIADEEWVLSRIQALRDQAYANGSLHDNEHLKVDHEEDVIVIQSVRDRVVYVPFYDTRVVYGSWWHTRAPYYWRHPHHYRYHKGFYWSPSINIASNFFFGGFNWHHGYVVINHNFPRHNTNHYYYGHKRVYSREFKRWSHNVDHRRARYNNRVVSYHAKRANSPSKKVKSRQVHKRYGEYQHATPIHITKHNHKQNAQTLRKHTTQKVVTRDAVTKPGKAMHTNRIAKLQTSTQRAKPLRKQTSQKSVKRDAVTKKSVHTNRTAKLQTSTQKAKPLRKQTSQKSVKRDAVTKKSVHTNRTAKLQTSTQSARPLRKQTSQKSVKRDAVTKPTSRSSVSQQTPKSRKLSSSTSSRQKQRSIR
jgi:hypothetical protein